MPSGKVLAVCETEADCVKVARDNRDMVVWSVQEIARILEADKKDTVDSIDAVKSLFPGAEVVSIRPIPKDDIDDEIPF